MCGYNEVMSLDSPIPLHFEGEESDEETLIVLRAHPVTNIGWIMMTGLLILLPLFSLVFLVISQRGDLPISLPTVVTAFLVWTLIVFGIALQQYLHWYFNLYILTNRRVVDIDFFGLFHRQISQTHLTSVQDITFSKGGVLQNFLDFGNMSLQTAGTETNFEFHNIPDPETNQKHLISLIRKIKNQNLKHNGV